MQLGINLGFAAKRWPEPRAWARLVREDLGLDLAQFSFDLLDPWWPQPERDALARAVRGAADAHGIAIHSAQVGLAWYTYNGLLHPDSAARRVAVEWWKRAAAVTALIGGRAVGGPLGALSISAEATGGARDRAYSHLLEALTEIGDAVASEGLEAILIEPTPLRREIPSTVDQARRLVSDLGHRSQTPVWWVLDVGHALYRPLYGADASLRDWLQALRDDIGVLHLQNHDYQADAHWGWPDPRGTFDVAGLGRELADERIDVPVLLEVFYPFELDDAQVHANVVSSVGHVRRALATSERNT